MLLWWCILILKQSINFLQAYKIKLGAIQKNVGNIGSIGGVGGVRRVVGVRGICYNWIE